MISFNIVNRHTRSMCLIIEPEGFEFVMKSGDSITVVATGGIPSLECNLSEDRDGMPCLAIWPCEGNFEVWRDGTNILSELQ